MNKIRAAVFGSTLTILFVGAAAMPASAVGTPSPPSVAASTATVTVVAGSLIIAAPAPAIFSGSDPTKAASATIAGVTVTDARAGTQGWVASVQMSDFADPLNANAPHITAESVTYQPTAATKVGTSTLTATTVTDLRTAKAVLEATGVVGFNTAIWGATLTIATPLSTLTGLYTATLTHSVL